MRQAEATELAPDRPCLGPCWQHGREGLGRRGLELVRGEPAPLRHQTSPGLSPHGGISPLANSAEKWMGTAPLAGMPGAVLGVQDPKSTWAGWTLEGGQPRSTTVVLALAGARLTLPSAGWAALCSWGLFSQRTRSNLRTGAGETVGGSVGWTTWLLHHGQAPGARRGALPQHQREGVWEAGARTGSSHESWGQLVSAAAEVPPAPT